MCEQLQNWPKNPAQVTSPCCSSHFPTCSQQSPTYSFSILLFAVLPPVHYIPLLQAPHLAFQPASSTSNSLSLLPIHSTFPAHFFYHLLQLLIRANFVSIFFPPQRHTQHAVLVSTGLAISSEEKYSSHKKYI